MSPSCASGCSGRGLCVGPDRCDCTDAGWISTGDLRFVRDEDCDVSVVYVLVAYSVMIFGLAFPLVRVVRALAQKDRRDLRRPRGVTLSHALILATCVSYVATGILRLSDVRNRVIGLDPLTTVFWFLGTNFVTLLGFQFTRLLIRLSVKQYRFGRRLSHSSPPAEAREGSSSPQANRATAAATSILAKLNFKTFLETIDASFPLLVGLLTAANILILVGCANPSYGDVLLVAQNASHAFVWFFYMMIAPLSFGVVLRDLRLASQALRATDSVANAERLEGLTRKLVRVRREFIWQPLINIILATLTASWHYLRYQLPYLIPAELALVSVALMMISLAAEKAAPAKSSNPDSSSPSPAKGKAVVAVAGGTGEASPPHRKVPRDEDVGDAKPPHGEDGVIVAAYVAQSE